MLGDDRNGARGLIFVVSAFLVVGLSLLGLPGVWGSSEAREGQVIWVILTSGEWVLPLRNGIVPSKPPLFHWVGAGLCWLFGSAPQEFFIRLPSLLAAGLMLGCTGGLAWRIFGDRRLTFLAPTVLALTYSFTRMALDARVDMVFALLSFAATASVVAKSSAVGGRQSPSFFLFWLFAGGAVLAKGPLGLALPLVSAFAALTTWVGFKRALLWLARPQLGWPVFVGLVLPWYLAAAQAGGEAFVARQITFENVARLLGGEDVNSRPWWYYLSALLSGFAPWWVLLLYGASRPRLEAERVLLGRRALWAWFGAGLVLFSAAAGKRASYLLPLLPVLATLVALEGLALFDRVSALGRARLLRLVRLACQVAAVSVLGLVVLAEGVVTVSFADPVPQHLAALLRANHWVLYLLGVGAVGGLIWFRCAANGSRQLLFSTYVGWLLLMVFGIQGGLWIKSELKRFAQAATVINRLVPMDVQLTVLKGPREEFFDPLFYYLRRNVRIGLVEPASVDCDGYFLVREEVAGKVWRAGAVKVARFTQVDASVDGREEFVLFHCAE